MAIQVSARYQPDIIGASGLKNFTIFQFSEFHLTSCVSHTHQLQLQLVESLTDRIPILNPPV